MSEDATAALSSTPMSWIGQPVKRVEDARLLTGRGTFIDDHPPVANAHHAAIVRSPHPHARILGYDVSAALAMDGVVGVDHGRRTSRGTPSPSRVGVTAPVRYYCAATDRVRFVGEPVAVVVAREPLPRRGRRRARRSCDYEPLPAVVDLERALEPDAPVLHEAVGIEPGRQPAARLRRSRRAPSARPRWSSASASASRSTARRRSRPTASIARWDPLDGVLHGLVELHGAVHHAPARPRACWAWPRTSCASSCRPTSAAASASSRAIYPYIALIALAAHADRACRSSGSRTGASICWPRPAGPIGWPIARWRRARTAPSSACASAGLTMSAATSAAPSPGCSFRPHRQLRRARTASSISRSTPRVVMTNKSLTGPNRGYACGHLYFETEGMMDRLADATGPRSGRGAAAESGSQPEQFPYRTPTGGLYDSGDYPAVLDKALELARYDELRREQAAARAAGRCVGIGARARGRSVRVEHGLRRDRARSAVPREARVPAEVRRHRRGDDQDRPARPRHRDSRHHAAGPGPPDGGVPDRRRRARVSVPQDVTVVDEMDTFTRVWSHLVRHLLEPLRLGGHERRRPGGAQAEGQARGLRGAPDGACPPA